MIDSNSTPKVCPECGSVLRVAYQKVGKEAPGYVVFCYGEVGKNCRFRMIGAQGKGATVDEAVAAFHAQAAVLRNHARAGRKPAQDCVGEALTPRKGADRGPKQEAPAGHFEQEALL